MTAPGRHMGRLNADPIAAGLSMCTVGYITGADASCDQAVFSAGAVPAIISAPTPWMLPLWACILTARPASMLLVTAVDV